MALHSRGEPVEAFRLAAPAFAQLHKLALADNPPAASILALRAPFFDEVARAVGQPDAAVEEMRTALALSQVRIPGHREGPFQPKVSTDSGDREHGFQGS